MINFPNMIDWIDERGLEDLHKLHEKFLKDYPNEKILFSDFVKNEYEGEKMQWEDFVYNTKNELRIKDDWNDTSIESACVIVKEILNKGIKEGMVQKIVVNDELAIDYDTAQVIVDTFFYQVIPTIEKTLNNLDE